MILVIVLRQVIRKTSLPISSKTATKFEIARYLFDNDNYPVEDFRLPYITAVPLSKLEELMIAFNIVLRHFVKICGIAHLASFFSSGFCCVAFIVF